MGRREREKADGRAQLGMSDREKGGGVVKVDIKTNKQTAACRKQEAISVIFQVGEGG